MRAYWASRSRRERTAIAIGAAAIATILVVAFAWLPLQRARARLAVEVPRLSASVAAMERQAAEVARVRSLPPVASAAAAPAAAVAASLARLLPAAQIAALDEKRVRISGADVPYGALLEAIAAAQSAHGLRVDTARIDALASAGRVRAEIVLARP